MEAEARPLAIESGSDGAGRDAGFVACLIIDLRPPCAAKPIFEMISTWLALITATFG
jgi:hypothetical protein